MPAGQPVSFLVVLRWDDSWAAACQDYDLAVAWQDPAAGPRAVASTAPQACQPGQRPVEVAAGTAAAADGQLAIVVRRKAGAAPVRLEVYAAGGELSIAVPEGSVAPPADLPQVLAAGAVASHDVRRLQPYSSRGPSPTGAIKPDFVAPDSVSTASYGSRAFAGTSAAAPHLAGLVALLKGWQPAWNVEQVRAHLAGLSLDLGPPGPDNDYGYGLPQLRQLPQAWSAPPPPSLVGIWPLEGDPAHAVITWQPPAGATRYRLESALEPTFSFGRNALEFPAGPVVQLVVGTPSWDGGVFYYRIAACSEQACSGWSPVLAVARRIWPGPEHWNLVAGGFRFLDRVYLWAQNGSPVPGKASDLHLYEGLQGYGGQERRTCRGVMPGSVCQVDFPAASALASASQSFPPYGEVGVGFWLG